MDELNDRNKMLSMHCAELEEQFLGNMESIQSDHLNTFKFFFKNYESEGVDFWATMGRPTLLKKNSRLKALNGARGGMDLLSIFGLPVDPKNNLLFFSCFVIFRNK